MPTDPDILRVEFSLTLIEQLQAIIFIRTNNTQTIPFEEHIHCQTFKNSLAKIHENLLDVLLTLKANQTSDVSNPQLNKN